jgi:3-dehydroquinate synthase
LGGGVVGDMGGFVAATYKRGIDFVQIPTTLLAMVDASVGGKLGIDFQGYKNHIGLYREPLGVYIYPPFLDTLPPAELRSGLAEVIKHHLIADAAAWPDLRERRDLAALPLEALIRHSVDIKARIVAADPQEQGLRKALNFGHTIGHALETARLNSEKPLLHGEAIAVGMIAESYLSQQRGLLSEAQLLDVAQYLRQIYPSVGIAPEEYEHLTHLARNDKKNEGGRILCTLLNGIGGVAVNQTITGDDIAASLFYYLAAELPRD